MVNYALLSKRSLLCKPNGSLIKRLSCCIVVLKKPSLPIWNVN